MEILIADDHQIVRKGLIHLLSVAFRNAQFCEAGTRVETLQVVRTNKLAALVLDINMPDTHGTETLSEVKQLCPELPVIVLSAQPEEQLGLRVLKAGASGYVSKDRAPEELVKAVQTALAGGKYVSATLAEKLALRMASDRSDEVTVEILSNREFAVLRLLYEGHPIKEIAAQLELSSKTVSTYRQRILEKLKVDNNSELVQYILKNHLFE